MNWSFDFFSSSGFYLLQLERKFFGTASRALRYFLIGLLILGLALWVLGWMGFLSVLAQTIGLLSVGVTLLAGFWQSFVFFKLLRVKPKASLQTALSLSKKEEINLAELLDVFAANLFLEAYETAEGRKKPPSALDLLLAFHSSSLGKYILVRSDMSASGKVKELIQDFSLKEVPQSEAAAITGELVKIVEAGLDLAKQEGVAQISETHLVLAAFKINPLFQKLLSELNLEYQDLINIVGWFKAQAALTGHSSFWSPAPVQGLGEDWSYGFTPTLFRFGRNLTKEIEMTGEIHSFGRNREIGEIERILAKSSQNNVLLVGEHGVGKKTIVKGFVSKIIKGEMLSSLKDKQVFEIDVGSILAGAGQKGAVEARLKQTLSEAVGAGNIILFIDDIHALFSSRSSEIGQINAAEIFLPYLKRSDLQVIGTTTYKEFHRDIEANPGVAAAFEKIEVDEVAKEDVLKILEEVVPRLELKNNTIFTYQALKEAIEVAERFMHDSPFPEKAIKLLDEVAIAANKTGQKLIRKELIDQIAEEKTKTPVAEASGSESEKLLKLEDILHQRVINQNEAIKAIASALRRARAGLKAKNRPIGSFLFLGPTGVGKTETAKALAAAYFGSDTSMIRFDMSEFQEESSVYRLIGAPPSSGKEGTQGELTVAVKDAPFSLILLDEIEKSHPKILTLFLQVLDDGRLTDGTGKTVDFANTIIIATSNAGAEVIRKAIQAAPQGEVNSEALKTKLLEYLQSQGIFRPEFLNRFDGVISFHPLTLELIKKVALLMIDKLNVRLKDRDVTVELTPSALNKLIEIGFDPTYGARPMQRAIQDRIENLLADKLLQGKIAKKSQVLIDEKDIISAK